MAQTRISAASGRAGEEVFGLQLSNAGIGKGGKRRLLVLPTGAREILRGYVEARGAELGSPLFPSYSTAWRLLRAMGAPHPHAWRHGYRARLRRAGVHNQVAQALLGHGPRTVTDRYGAVTLAEMLEAAERLGCDDAASQ